MSEELHRALWLIEGELKGINQRLDGHGVRLTSIDDRLRTAETSAAHAGGRAGVLTGVGVALLIESARAWAKSKGLG